MNLPGDSLVSFSECSKWQFVYPEYSCPQSSCHVSGEGIERAGEKEEEEAMSVRAYTPPPWNEPGCQACRYLCILPESVLISLQLAPQSMVRYLGFYAHTWQGTGASVPVLMAVRKTVKYKGVTCVHGRTREESCYWILLTSKRYRKLLVRIKERKKNKERRKGKKRERRNPKRTKGIHGRRGAAVPNAI